MKTRQEIKAIARDAIAAQRGTSILLALVVGAIGVVSSILDSIFDIGLV
jgi:uncharacterized membrane protein